MENSELGVGRIQSSSVVVSPCGSVKRQLDVLVCSSEKSQELEFSI